MQLSDIISYHGESKNIGRSLIKVLLHSQELETQMARLLSIASHDYLAFTYILQQRVSTPGELSRLTRSNSSTTSMSLDRLEKANKIVRKRSTEDRRKVEILPTKESIETIAEYINPIILETDKVVDKMSDNEIGIVMQFLDSMAEIMEETLLDIINRVDVEQADVPKKIKPAT